MPLITRAPGTISKTLEMKVEELDLRIKIVQHRGFQPFLAHDPNFQPGIFLWPNRNYYSVKKKKKKKLLPFFGPIEIIKFL